MKVNVIFRCTGEVIPHAGYNPCAGCKFYFHGTCVKPLYRTYLDSTIYVENPYGDLPF